MKIFSSECNYYGSLCTQMYELLHPVAEKEELEFYLSFAKKGMKILEPMCGSGRFMLPFVDKGFDITGFDSSKEMIDTLVKKDPNIKCIHSDFDNFETKQLFDFAFIASSSFSLFLTEEQVNSSLKKMGQILNKGALFILGVESNHIQYEEIKKYKERDRQSISNGNSLILKIKQHYDSTTKVLHMPNLYELYNEENQLVKEETMDFRIKLYEDKELGPYLERWNFKIIDKFNNYNKESSEKKELILYVCLKQ